jgi:CheY-like chemotaxis protein
MEAVTILIVEDDDGHATLITRNLKRAGISNNIIRVSDGQAGLDFILAQGAYAGRSRNSFLVVLLDLNLPKIDGIDLLRQIKTGDDTKHIPVILLTTSDNPQEIALAYELGCSVYVPKPVEAEAFAEAIRRIGLFIQIVALPNGDHPTH